MLEFSMLRSKAADGAEYVKHKGSEIRERASEMLNESTAALAQKREGVEAAVRAGSKAYRDVVHS